MAELRPWLNSRKTGNFYTIVAYKKLISEEYPFDDDELIEVDVTLSAFSEIVEISSFTAKPKILKVNPYQNIPARPVVRIEEEFLE